MDRRNFRYSVLLFLLLVVVIFAWTRFSGNAPSGPGSKSHPGGNASPIVPNVTGTVPGTAGQTPLWGVQSKTTGCQVRGPLQDPGCTPGAIFPNATKADICTPGYARSVRDVPQSVKDKVYASYGISSHLPGQYEVDHLVSLQLGGSNDIANLWPEASSPKPGFHEKDAVENYLHAQICSGAISLKDAQVEIATNWLAVYNRMSNKQTAPGDANGAP